MKRSIYQFALAAAMILTVGISSSFATPVNDLDNINASFHKDFRKAELLATNVTADYTKLTFKMNGMVLFAFIPATESCWPLPTISSPRNSPFS